MTGAPSGKCKSFILPKQHIIHMPIAGRYIMRAHQFHSFGSTGWYKRSAVWFWRASHIIHCRVLVRGGGGVCLFETAGWIEIVSELSDDFLHPFFCCENFAPGKHIAAVPPANCLKDYVLYSGEHWSNVIYPPPPPLLTLVCLFSDALYSFQSEIGFLWGLA